MKRPITKQVPITAGEDYDFHPALSSALDNLLEQTFTTEDAAEREADARNSEGSGIWQTAFVHDGDDGYWIVELQDDDEEEE